MYTIDEYVNMYNVDEYVNMHTIDEYVNMYTIDEYVNMYNVDEYVNMYTVDVFSLNNEHLCFKFIFERSVPFCFHFSNYIIKGKYKQCWSTILLI